MPVLKCPNWKYRIGSGPCMYTSKAAAERAYAAYRAKSNSEADPGIYLRYSCTKCKSERVLPKEFGSPLILLCKACDGFMKPVPTVLLKSDQPESRYREMEGYRTLFLEQPQETDEVLPIGKGDIELVHRESQTIAVRFRDSWTEGMIRKWMWIHFPIVRIESTRNLGNIPVTLRTILQNRQELFNEWRQHYIDAIDEPFPNLVAWRKLSERWVKGASGRWTRV